MDITSDKSGRSGPPPGRNVSRAQYYDKHKNSSSHNTAKNPGEPATQPKPDQAKTEDEKQALKVTAVNFNVLENTRNHRTDKYENTEDRVENGKTLPAQLVVRRGQPFDLSIKFDRPYDKAKDDLKLIFDVGKKPMESKGTRVLLVLSDTDKAREWGARILRMNENELTVRIFTPPNCIIGKWLFKFDAILKKGDQQKIFRYTHENPVYVLFNPWCPDDQVYLDDEISRQEYVLNDRGRIYRGTQKQISAKPWNFGQFEDFMLDCVFYLLDLSELSYRVRGNPVHVARKISAVTNAPDDGGVLVGNWSGNYTGGTTPLQWVGSVNILEKYWKTKQPVKFGQCWVFSAVVTTICRALGIPARSVTNFSSAHDCDGSITVDCHWTPEGQPLDELNADSVWNFHVWNDVWMARPDLPSGFGGWQAIDATPQETSDGVYCAGPASVEAIKNGLVHLPYDGPFIFAEVNADRIHWIQLPDSNWTNTKQAFSVGKFISTKSATTDSRMDVTYVYKFPEGSQQERTAVWRAAKEGSTRKDVYEVKIKDMSFDLINKEDTMIGQPIEVVLKVHNKSMDLRNVKATLTGSIIYYTGVPVKSIKSETYNVKVPSGADGEVKMTLKVDDYLDKLVDMANIKMSCMVQVKETNQFHCDSDDFRLLKPELTLKAPAEVKVGEEYEVEVSFTNPLPRSLTKCEFEIEGAGVIKTQKFKHNTIGPHAEGKVVAKVTARKAGQREIVASFDSKELADVCGSTLIKVNPKVD